MMLFKKMLIFFYLIMFRSRLLELVEGFLHKIYDFVV